MDSLNIKELIGAIREELKEAQAVRETDGELPMFYVDNVKLEVNFIIEKVKSTGGGFNLKVVDMNRNVALSETQVHKVSVELKTPIAKSDYDGKLKTLPGGIKFDDRGIFQLNTPDH